MKSTWTLPIGDDIAVTTSRGPWEPDVDFLARHEVEVTNAIDDAIDPEDVETTVGDHILDLTADLPTEGDDEEKEITLP